MMTENISCEEYFEHLKIMAKEQNLSFQNMYYIGEPVIWKTPDYIGYAKILAYFVIIVGGLLGNLSVILTVALVKSMRNTINFYVTNLAVADSMICIICMLPHALTVYTGENFVLGKFMCKFTPFTQMSCLTSSVLTLCAISGDRFMAVFRPLEVRTTEKRVTVIMSAIWIISIAVSIPFLFVKKHLVIEWLDFREPKCSEEWPISYYRAETTNKCETDQPLRKVYYVAFTVTLFFGPIFIMMVAYLMILFKLWTSRIPGEQSEANTNLQSKSRQKVLKMVFLVLVVFVICWTPFIVVALFSAFGYGMSKHRPFPYWYPEFKWCSFFISYANSVMNPFIYGQYNKNFRDGFCFVLRCGFDKSRRKSSGTNIFVKSARSLSTTLNSLKSRSHPFLSNRKSNAPSSEVETQITPL